jgi:hypothetical protein
MDVLNVEVRWKLRDALTEAYPNGAIVRVIDRGTGDLLVSIRTNEFITGMKRPPADGAMWPCVTVQDLTHHIEVFLDARGFDTADLSTATWGGLRWEIDPA